VASASLVDEDGSEGWEEYRRIVAGLPAVK
jgi:hypothetical protein